MTRLRSQINRRSPFLIVVATLASASWMAHPARSSDAGLANASNDLSPTEILDRSLKQRYGYDYIQRLRIIQREDTSSDERETRLEMLQKVINSRVHNLVRFSHPEEMRGTRVLTIERENRSDDHFAFLRSQQKIRRVRSRRGDSFVGTDFSMEDLEKREVSDFRVLGMTSTHVDGESVYVVSVEPVYDSAYFRMEYLVAASDFSNLGIRYFKEGTDEPFKHMIVPRESIKQFREGLRLGLHAYVRDFRRRTETHVYLDEVTIDPPLKDSLFTTSSLQHDRRAPPAD